MESGERFERLMAEHQRYNDALLERHAGISAEQITAIDAMSQRSDANFTALQSEIADQRDQIQAQTQALLQVLDRLPPAPPQG